MSLFSQSNAKFITHTPLTLERINQELIGSISKTTPRGRVKVVQDKNEDTSVWDEVFQVSELVEPYRVTHSIDLEKNLNFHVFDDSLINVDIKELNVVLSSNDKHMSMKMMMMMISTSKIGMELMTIQLTKKKKKKKILTNYQNTKV